MRKIAFLFVSYLLLQSCAQDLGSIKVTYLKATAIYGDLEEVRNTALLDQSRAIENPGKIFVAEKYLLVGEEGKGIHLFDNTNEANPIPVSFLNIPGNREFFVQGNTLYAESFYDMLKIDLSDWAQPRIVSRVKNTFADPFTNPSGQILIGFDYQQVTEELKKNSSLYEVTQTNQDILNSTIYFDYANQLIPPSAVPASFVASGDQALGTINRIARYRDFIYVISRSNLFTFSDKESLELLQVQTIGNNMETIYPHDNQIFIGTPTSMLVYGLDNPENPNYLSSFEHATSCDPVLPVGEVTYLTLRTGDFSTCRGDINALLVLDISDIRNPVQKQEIGMKSPYGMSLIGRSLFVGEGENGLKIFDATNKTNLSLLKWNKTVEAYDVIQHPTKNNLVLIAGTKGLGQYQIDDDNTLSLLGWIAY